MAVIGPDGGAFREVAESIAQDRDEPLVTDLAEVDGGPLIYVDDPANVSADDAYDLQERLLAAGPSDGGFGIVTGFTPEHAERLYFEEAEYGDGHALLLRKLYEDRFSYDDETTVLTEDRASVPELRRQSESGLDSLTLFSSGWAIHLFVTDGYVCGIPNSVDVDDYDGLNPTCAVEGGGECPLDGDLVRAEALDASHVFVNSCAPMLNNGVDDLPVHVGLSLLSGADSLVGSYRLMSSTQHEAVLHYAMLRSGYDLAERTYVLNRNAHKLGMKSHPYLGFGPPERTSRTAVEPEYNAEVTETEAGAEVTVSEFAGHVADVRIDGSVVGPAPEYFVTNLTDELADAPLYYTAFAQDDGVRVLLYSWGYFEADEVTVEVLPDQPHREEKATILDSAQQMGALETFGLLDDKVSGQLSDFRNKLGGLPEYLYDERFDANAFRETRGRLDQLEDSVDRIHDRITDWLADRRYAFLFSDSKPNGIPTTVYRSERECNVCGRRVFVRELTDVHGNHARALGTCPRCGYVFDVPTGEEGEEAGGSDLPVPEFETDLMQAGEQAQSVTLSFENPRDAPLRARILPWLKSERDEYHGAPLFDPDELTVALDPNETVEFEFEIDLPALNESENVRENKYHVFVFVVGNANIYTASSRLFVGGSEEYPFYYD